MKIDKHVRDISHRLDTISNRNGNGNGRDNNNGDDDYGTVTEYDDEYYLDIGQDPPRFFYYRYIRAEQWEALGHKCWGHEYDHRITQGELDFRLKKELRISPEQRYQHEKEYYYFHELYVEGGRECNPIYEGCTPKCRFHTETGRIEDEEIIEEHNKHVESLRRENAIVEPPSKEELLRLAKIEFYFCSMMDQKCPSMDYFLYKGDHPYHVIINKGPYKS